MLEAAFGRILFENGVSNVPQTVGFANAGGIFLKSHILSMGARGVKPLFGIGLQTADVVKGKRVRNCVTFPNINPSMTFVHGFVSIMKHARESDLIGIGVPLIAE